MVLNVNKRPLRAACWDYDLNENDIYDILTNKYYKISPISKEQLSYKLFKMVKFEKIKNIFSRDEIIDILNDINIDKIKSTRNKEKIELFLDNSPKNSFISM